MIHNPILPGFHADPCLCRKGDDIYLAVSSFEWFPGIPIYHTRDMKHWDLYAHALQNDRDPDLRNLPSAKGIWAPCLTYCGAEDLFYVVYGVMHSMNARYFDIDNYLITAKDPKGPWSKPVYLHSIGFDASLFHDDDGKKYLVALEWETRDGYEKPGPISMVEYDPVEKRLLGLPKPIWRGGTDRGCLEGPHITKRGEYYYIMCAEGGTGYYHCVTMGRSQNVWGPYEQDPCNPILTSFSENRDERQDVDHLKPRYYNPDIKLQKAGHGSYVDLPNGETWLAYHCSRPFLPELRCTLGRETALARMRWMEDGWLRLWDGDNPADGNHPAVGDNLAREWVEDSALPEYPAANPTIPAAGQTFPLSDPDALVKSQTVPAGDTNGTVSPKTNSTVPLKSYRDDFDGPDLALDWYAPRIDPRSFADTRSRPGWVRLRGQESGCSLHQVSFLAKKLTSLHASAATKMDYTPLCHQHSAGLMLYYDNMNFLYLRKYFSDTLHQSALAVIQLENGTKTEFPSSRTPVEDGRDIWMRVVIDGRASRFQWSLDGEKWTAIGPVFDTSKLSDEYSRFGEFTGTFVGIVCADRLTRSRTADFDFFDYREYGEENTGAAG